MNANTVKYIFFGVILIVAAGLIYTNIAATKQDNRLITDYMQYEETIQLIENGATELGISELEQLIEKYPDEYALYYQLGLAYSASGDFQKAALQYQQALNIRPALLQDQQFTYRMGEALYHIAEHQLAETYLSMPAPEEFQEQQQQYLQEINNQAKS